MHHHPNGIAHQEEVAALVQDSGDGGGVGGEADDGLAALASRDVWGGEATGRLRALGGHESGPAPSGGASARLP